MFFFLLFLFLFCRRKAGAGLNFRYSSENSPPVEKSRPLLLFGFKGSLQLLTSTIKKGSSILIATHAFRHRQHHPAPEPPLPHAEAAPAARPFLPLSCRFCLVSSSKPPAMVRTRGGHRYRPRVHTCSPSRDAAGTSRAVADHSPAQGAEAPPALSPATAMMQSPISADIPEEPQGVEPPSRRYNTQVGPRPPSPCIHGLHGGHRLPSGLGHLTRGSLHILGPSLHSLQLLRVLHGHRLNYPLPRELGVHYFTVTRYPGMWIVMPRTSTESSFMIYQH